MHLLYPSFLWALAALAIPILVHLFNFRKAKLVRFSNVKFLEAVKKKSASTRNLKHLLILTARLLFIFFLVMTFTQPFIPGAEKGLNSSQVDLYIDNSPSMSNLTVDNITGLASAVQIGEQVLALYPDATKFRLVTNDFSPSSNQYRSKENTLNELYDLDFSGVIREGQDVMDRLTRNNSQGNDIYLISDFQKSTMGRLNVAKDSSNQYHLVPVNFTEFSNLLVDSVYLKTPFVIDGQRNQLIARLKNHTDQPIQDLPIKLQINNRQSASATVSLDPKSYQNVTFELDTDLRNINKGLVRIDDYPITFDNDYYFSFNEVKNIKIVEISNTQQESPVSKVYSDNQLFKYSQYSQGNISYSSVKNADVLILNNLKKLEKGLRISVSSLLESGKAVVVIPNENCQASNLSEILDMGFQKVERPEKESLKAPDLNHPFFESIFEEASNSMNQPSAKVLWNWQSLDDRLLETKTGNPFLSQITSKGMLYIFASSLESENSDFTRNALFVAVMQRIAEKSSALNQQLAYELEPGILQLQLDSLSKNELYKLKQDQDEIAPSQRANGNQLFLDLPSYLMKNGFYDVISSYGTMATLAFNHTRIESDLAVLSLTEIAGEFEAITNVEVHDSPDAKKFSKSMKDKYQGIELWKYALILSMVFLVAEILLIRFL